MPKRTHEHEKELDFRGHPLTDDPWTNFQILSMQFQKDLLNQIAYEDRRMYYCLISLIALVCLIGIIFYIALLM